MYIERRKACLSIQTRPTAGSIICTNGPCTRQTTTKCVPPLGRITTTIAGKHAASSSNRKSAGRIAWETPSQFSRAIRSEEHTSELQSHHDLVCRLLLEKKKKKTKHTTTKTKV